MSRDTETEKMSNLDDYINHTPKKHHQDTLQGTHLHVQGTRLLRYTPVL